MLKLELWGGHECTVNRVHDVYRDQTILSGHQDRLSDLALFAELGIKALRYPVVWERVAPEAPTERDWRWTDERLGEIRRLGMRPIAGLLHHGSGPAYTSLVSDDFVSLFADYAGNLPLYPKLHAWLRGSGVPVLAVWGRNDEIFRSEGALAFARDAPHAEIHLLDGGHFLLESHLDAAASLIRGFLARTLR